MSAVFYKWLHVSAILMAFMAWSTLLTQPVNRKLAASLHGLGMLLIFISGFGLIAKGGFGFQPWVLTKIGIWGFTCWRHCCCKKKTPTQPKTFFHSFSLRNTGGIYGFF